MAKSRREDQPGDIVYVYEDPDEKFIWTYNYAINKNGPISVECISKIEPMELPKKKRKKT